MGTTTIKRAGLAGLVVVLGGLLGGPAARAATLVPSTTDLFDVSRGTTVTAKSTIGSGTSVETVLGKVESVGGENNGIYFVDGRPLGYVHFIEFLTATPVTIRSLALWSGDDRSSGNAGRRAFSEFKFYGWNGTAFQTLIDRNLTIPYPTQDATFGALNVAENIAPFTADRWRVEFVQPAAYGGVLYGPRVIEVDGFGTADLPEPGGCGLLLAACAARLGRRRPRPAR